MQCKYYGNCKHQNESCKSNTALLKCVYGLNEYCTEKAWEIDALREENKELKRMLKMAVEDFSRIDGVCGDYYDNVCDECPCKVNILGSCKWKHAEEALKLIGDEDNG